MRLIYDNKKAIEFICKYLPNKPKNNVSADDIDCIINLADEYIEDQNLLEKCTYEATRIKRNKTNVLSFIKRRKTTTYNKTTLFAKETSFIKLGPS